MKLISSALILSLFLLVCFSNAEEKFKPAWESLATHNEEPEWLKDAKLGIYFHWGIYSVPAYSSEWYPRNMHLNHPANKYHIKTYGDPTVFGYHDFVPLFKVEKFDAEEWAKLFKDAGAKFAGPVCEHHDGFSMWDSKFTPWNSMNKGPKRDITGELAKAIRKYDMKLITTFHHARNNLWKKGNTWTGHYDGIMKNYPSLLENPENAILYGYMPRDKFVKMWLNKLEEVIDNYQPDIIWFDSWLDEIPENTRQEFCAYYLNQANKWGEDVAIIRKQNDLPLSVSINDHEKSREPKALPKLWMTDDTISTGSWCYTNNLKIKSLHKVVHSIIDTVSKNGVILLNISPMADGSIPEDQKNVLYGLGNWLKINGEAIYNTRPWKIAGQGPTTEPAGGFSKANEFLNLEYTSDDIRFTCSKDEKTLYAICMGWPETPLLLDTIKVVNKESYADVQLLGNNIKPDYTIETDGSLLINTPKLHKNELPWDSAYVFKLTGFKFDVNPFGVPEAVTLKAEDAVLDGRQIACEEAIKGRKNIGVWNDNSDTIHWLVRIANPGKYQLRGEFASAAGEGSLKLQIAEQSVFFNIPATKNWADGKMVEIGRVNFHKAGIYHLILSTDKSKSHKPVNVWQIQFAPADK